MSECEVRGDVKRSVAEFWADHKAEITLTVVSLVVFGFLIRITNRDDLTPSDLTQIGTLMILVIVTVSYAASTHRIERAAREQAEAARKQAEETQHAVELALRSERNAVMPIVNLEGHGPYFGSSATASLTNVGKGPALGLRISAIVKPDSDGEYLESDLVGIPAFEVGRDDEVQVPFSEAQGPIVRRWEECKLMASYRDIYGQYFRSTFTLTRSGGFKFDYDRLGAPGSPSPLTDWGIKDEL